MRDDDRLLAAACAISDAIDADAPSEQAASHAQRGVDAQIAVLADLIHAWRGRPPSQARQAPGGWGGLRILQQIGEGTFSDVFLAIDPHSGREVALKLLKPGPWPSNAIAHGIIEDCRALARLRHSNVIAVYGAACHDGRLGIWMERLHGPTIEQRLADRGPVAAREAVLIGLDVCRGVSAVHRAGLLHGDIKAQNVVQACDGRNVLVDVAGAGGHLAGRPRPLLIATPLCVAPEVLSWQPATVRSEVYSIGVLLYHLVTGGYPVTGRSLQDLRDAHASGRRQSLADRCPGLPGRFVTVVERALARAPSRRYPAVAALHAALARVQAAF